MWLLDKLLTKLWDVAMTNRRWPLLLPPVLISGAFAFALSYYGLSFRPTLDHYWFRIFSGAVLLLSGLLYPVVPHIKIKSGQFRLPYPTFEWKHRLWLSGTLAVAGVILIVAGMKVWPERQPPELPKIPSPLPEDKLVVTIANFTSPSDLPLASEFTALLEADLREKMNKGAPLIVKRPMKPVAGYEEGKRNDAAKVLGNSTEESHAHVVLWGEVRKGDESNFIGEARLTVANEWQKADIEGSIAKFSPNISFKKRSTSREDISKYFADIVPVVVGVAYYRVKNWDEAIKTLETAKSGEGYLYKGLCYYEKAQNSSNKREDLQTAIDIYETIIDDLNDTGSQWDEEEKRKLAARTYPLLGDAYLGLGEYSAGQVALTHFQNAVQNYGAALSFKLELDNLWAVENNFGVAQYELGIRSGENQMAQYLQGAEEAYRSALKDCAGEEKDCALVHNNLGSALARHSAGADGEQKSQLLKDAERELEQALDFYNRERPSKRWAMAQNNYANILLDKGKQMPIGQGDDDDLRRAVEAYNSVLEVYDREKESQKHATVQNNLGSALYELWKRKQVEKDLQDALAAFRTAVDIRNSTRSPMLANSKLGLAKTLTELGKRPEAEDKAGCLNEAIQIFDELLSIYSRNYPKKRQEIRAEKAEAMKALRAN